MDQIREMLDRIGELDAEQLDELENSILTEFDTVEGQDPTRETVDQMTELASAAEAVRGEKTRRGEEAAQLSAERDAATARIRGEDTAQAKDPNDDSEEGQFPGDGATAPADGEAVPETGDLPADQEETDPNETIAPDEDEQKVKKATGLSTDEPAESTASATEPETTEAPVTADATTVVDAPAEAEAAIEFEHEDISSSQPAVQPAEIKEPLEVGKPDAEITSPAEQAASIDAHIEANAEAATKTPDEAEASTDTATAGEDSEATMTAAGSEQGTVEVPADRRPKSLATATVAITAGADIPGLTAGSTLPDMRAVAEALLKRKNGMRSTSGGDGEQHTVATFTTSYPEERVLSATDLAGNAGKIEDVTSPAAVTAGGGLCAPVEVRYDIFGVGVLGRPVRDALAVFSADRGGIRFVTPPVLSNLNGAVSTWTVQDDIDSSTVGAPDPVKPCIRVACGTETVVYTDAIPLCLTFGNMGARAYPELVERHTQLGMIWHARYAEQRLLTRIGALSTQVTAGKKIGAARDFFVHLERAAAGYRNRHRMAVDAPLRVILPSWFLNELRADLVMQMPGDGQDETFALADSFVNSWFNVRHINVTWTIDGEAGQILGAQSTGALNDFPTTVVWYLFAEGSFLFLDGGTLDLGLVRDSTLNGTNDYKIFLETFEGVAMVGVESLRVTSTLQVNGSAAGLTNTVS